MSSNHRNAPIRFTTITILKIWDFCFSDAVAKAAESGAEAVEKIAKATEKIASEIADELPDGVSLKEKALQIEQICEEVDRDAERAEIFIHKVFPTMNFSFPRLTSHITFCLC